MGPEIENCARPRLIGYSAGATHDEETSAHTTLMPRAPKKPKKAKKPKVDRLKPKVGEETQGDGELWQTCQAKCPTRTRPVKEFAPRRGAAKLAKFERAVALYKETKSADARATIVEHATTTCNRCRDGQSRSDVKKTTKRGICRAYWHKLKATTFHTCVDCEGTRCIEADNIKTDDERAVLFEQGKVKVAEHHPLSDYKWWVAHGGVEGMRLEAEVCEPRCRMCHTLQPSSAAGNRVDPNTLPQAVDKECKVDPKMYDKRRKAAKRWPRYCYNDGLKRAIGQCENLNCLRDGPRGGECVAGVEQAFDWEHTNAAAKLENISRLCANLPVNMPEAEWKAEIDAELERGACKLLCRNCHHLTTHHGMVPRYE